MNKNNTAYKTIESSKNIGIKDKNSQSLPTHIFAIGKKNLNK